MPTWYDEVIAEPRTPGQLIKWSFRIQESTPLKTLQHSAKITTQMKMLIWQIWTPYLKIIRLYLNYHRAHRSRRIQSYWTMLAIKDSLWLILRKQQANTRALDESTISYHTANQAIPKLKISIRHLQAEEDHPYPQSLRRISKLPILESSHVAESSHHHKR